MAFHLFGSDEAHRIPGKKEQTADQGYVVFHPDYVYIPCQDGKGNPLNNALEVGTHVLKGTLLGTRQPDDFPIYSSVEGTIVDTKKVLTASGMEQNCFVIKADSTIVDHWDLKKPLGDVKDVSNEEIIAAIKESGVIGFGGAGFPTYRKFNSGKTVDVLIVNAIECEPYLTTDYVYGAKEVDYLFKALPYLLKLTGAKEVAFCTKADKPALIQACESGMKLYPSIPMKLYKTADKYPMGYERNLVTLVTKKQYNMIPIEAGAIVDNIFTFIALGKFFTEGKIPADRCITVAGCVHEPANVLTPYGVLASSLINDVCDGISIKGDYKVINGGPMNGNALSSIDYVTFMQTNGIVALKPNKYRAEPCWHCGNCCDNCPMDLQPVQIQIALKRNDVERMIELKADRCCGCGLCSYMCPSRIEVSQNVMKAKAIVLQALKEGKK